MAIDLLEEKLTRSVIGAFYEVYNTLGYGYLEYVYMLALEQELRARGHEVAREVPVAVIYKGRELAVQRLDMVVDGKLVIEAKATEMLHPSAKRQLVSYLKSTRLSIGLLLHFGPEPKVHRAVYTKGKRARAQSPLHPSDPQIRDRSSSSTLVATPSRPPAAPPPPAPASSRPAGPARAPRSCAP